MNDETGKSFFFFFLRSQAPLASYWFHPKSFKLFFENLDFLKKFQKMKFFKIFKVPSAWLKVPAFSKEKGFPQYVRNPVTAIGWKAKSSRFPFITCHRRRF